MFARFTLALAACVPWAATAQDRLPASVQLALQQARLPASALGAVALPLGHGAPAWAHAAHRPMQPGSAMKVATAIVALDRLGPGHRSHTELRSAAPLQGGVLQGDLVLKGGADPELDVPAFWALLLDLRGLGINHVAGDLRLDRTLFSPARPDLGLPPFDDAPEFGYNVVPDALQLAGSLLPLTLAATAGGVQAASVPPLPGVDIESRMLLTDARCRDWAGGWQPATVTSQGGRTRIVLNGAFPRGCTQRVGLQLLDRTELADRLFRTLWQGLGGTWAGRAVEVAEAVDTAPVRAPAAAPEAAAPAGADTRLLARRHSRPWGELLRPMMKESDNVLARLLYLQLGVQALRGRPGRTADASAQVVRDWLARHAIDSAGLVLDNGSGLSRSERLSAWQLAAMLQAAWAGPHAADLAMSLPVAGVDGTLRNRLKNSPATGWARLKTGTLRNAVALAGYVTDGLGRPWAVAMMVNTDDTEGAEGADRARPVLDALVDSIARGALPGTAPAWGVGPQAVGPQGEGP